MSQDNFVDDELNVSNSDISYFWFSMMGPGSSFQPIVVHNHFGLQLMISHHKFGLYKWPIKFECFYFM